MKGVPEDQALDYVAGYAPANDVGLHDFRHADRGSMLRVKGQDGFLPIGPALVPADEFDPLYVVVPLGFTPRKTTLQCPTAGSSCGA